MPDVGFAAGAVPADRGTAHQYGHLVVLRAAKADEREEVANNPQLLLTKETMEGVEPIIMLVRVVRKLTSDEGLAAVVAEQHTRDVGVSRWGQDWVEKRNR